MATRKKYKIVLSEKYVRKSENGKEWFQFPVNISGQLVAIQTIIPLDPYTEPDMEQVRKEGYQQGLSDAKEGKATCQYCEYQYLDDTEEPCKKCCNAYMNKYKPKAKEEQIQVGDEVVGTYTGEEETEPFVIIRKIPEINPTYYFGIYSKSGEFCQGGLKLKKTGRHFPEIAEVLQKMKES